MSILTLPSDPVRTLLGLGLNKRRLDNATMIYRVDPTAPRLLSLRSAECMGARIGDRRRR